MKVSFRQVCLVVLVLVAVLAVAGCRSRSRDVLVMATSADFPPFEFVNDAGEYDGFDVHMARALAEILDMELRIDNMEFTSVIPAVVTGSADVGIAAITANDERRLTVDFTIPYFQTTLVVVVDRDSGITSSDQLETARVAVQLNTTSDLMAEWFLPDADIRRFERAPDTVAEINTGRVEAIIVDRGVADQFISDNRNLVILDEVLAVEEYAIAVSKDNADLTRRLNDALTQLKNSGEFQRIYDMFFGGGHGGS